MRLDAKLANLLSSFFLDIAKAYFIGTFIAPSLTDVSSLLELLLILTRGLGSAIVALVFSWYFAKLEEKDEPD